MSYIRRLRRQMSSETQAYHCTLASSDSSGLCGWPQSPRRMHDASASTVIQCGSQSMDPLRGTEYTIRCTREGGRRVIGSGVEA